MRELTEPKVLRRQTERLRRLVLLGLACLIAPAVLLIEVLTGDVHDGLTIAVLLRGAFGPGARAVSAGRSACTGGRLTANVDCAEPVRRFSPRLIAAEVSTVVTEAVTRLLPPGRPHRVLLDIAEPSDDARGEPDPTVDAHRSAAPALIGQAPARRGAGREHDLHDAHCRRRSPAGWAASR